MKTLSPLGGGLVLASPSAARGRNSYDDWPSHAASHPSFGAQLANSGQYYPYFLVNLKDGQLFWYFGAAQADFLSATNVVLTWQTTNLAFGANHWTGEAFNATGRPSVVEKVNDLNFSAWYTTH